MAKESGRRLVIGETLINDESNCYVIAEIGHNHKGELETCKEMFRVAKNCGANAVKLQKRDNRALYTGAMYNQPYNSENAYGDTYGTHREALEFGWEEYVELKKLADEIGLHFFSTPFDFQSADFLRKLGVPAYKLASGDLRSIPLMKYVASFGKPIIISTGGASFEDVERAYEAISPINDQIAILQCTAAYPTPFDRMDLKVIETFRERFPKATVGLSAHDSGIAMAVAAYVLGARVLEKHFTLNRAWKGTDHAFSLEPVGMKKMVRDLERTRIALGSGEKTVYPEEKKPITKMGKKIVAARQLKRGEIIREQDLTIKSPGDGLPPYYFDRLIGQEVKMDLEVDSDLSLDAIKPLHDGPQSN